MRCHTLDHSRQEDPSEDANACCTRGRRRSPAWQWVLETAGRDLTPWLCSNPVKLRIRVESPLINIGTPNIVFSVTNSTNFKPHTYVTNTKCKPNIICHLLGEKIKKLGIIDLYCCNYFDLDFSSNF